MSFFGSLKARLIRDGFDRSTINSVYKDPKVYLDKKIIKVYFYIPGSQIELQPVHHTEIDRKGKSLYQRAHGSFSGGGEKLWSGKGNYHSDHFS